MGSYERSEARPFQKIVETPETTCNKHTHTPHHTLVKKIKKNHSGLSFGHGLWLNFGYLCYYTIALGMVK